MPKSKLFILFIPCLVLTSGLMLFYNNGWTIEHKIHMTQSQPAEQSELSSTVKSELKKQQQCDDVLHKMLTGSWRQTNMTSEEVETMRRFHKRVREEEHGMYRGMQRPDNKCGNVNMGQQGTLHYFRGLCDPEGATPCCLHDHCANRTVPQCAPPACPDCFDMRTPIQAEYATWRPVDAACEPRSSWPVADICRLLGRSTLRFVGDSLVRHVYTALLLAVRGDDITGAYKKNIPQKLRSQCRGIYMFTEKECRFWLDANTTACDGNVRLSFTSLLFVRQAQAIHRNVLGLVSNSSRSLVLLGLGIHDHLKPAPMRSAVLGPLLGQLQSRRGTWPKVLWAALHQFSILRTPLTEVNRVRAVEFNKEVNALIEEKRGVGGEGGGGSGGVGVGGKAGVIEVFDTVNLTDNVMSFDGQHYGFGVNRMKARILLHYIQQLKDRGQW